jgi:hypothetical protein
VGAFTYSIDTKLALTIVTVSGGVDLKLGEKPLPIRLSKTTIKFAEETLRIKGFQVKVAV